jgi:hypothetical protein
MADRDDITVVQDVSPRYAEIAAPSTEIIMQDYVDTLRGLEDDFQNMSYPYLIEASGKEDLGGGVLVAITVEEQELQLAFQPRFTPAETGFATSASGPPDQRNRQTLIDTNADFVTAQIAPGSYLVNWTDRSVSDVLRVVSATQLEVRALQNGTDNDFDISDDYTIWNVTQVRTSGGNLVAVDDVGASISAILPTWGTQVILTTSSSATIQELDEIRFAAYDGGVSLDPSDPNAISGTDYPAGTRAVPSNNWADALVIGVNLGLKKLYLNGTSYTVPASTDLSGDLWIIGNGATVTTLTIPDSANTANLRIQDCYLEACYIDDANLVERSVLNDCYISGGYYFETAWSGTTNMTGSGQVNIYESYSAVAGGGPLQRPVFVVGTAIVAGRNWTGGCEFQGKTSTAGFSWDMTSGRVIINDNNTTGTMTLRGTGTWENSSTYAGTATVDDQMQNVTSIAAAVWNALTATYQAAGSFGEFVQSKLLTLAKFLGLKDV